MPNFAFLKAEQRAESADLLHLSFFFNFTPTALSPLLPPLAVLVSQHCGSGRGDLYLSHGWVAIGQSSAQKPFAPFRSLPTAGWDRHRCCQLGRDVPQALGKRGEGNNNNLKKANFPKVMP